MLPDDEQTLHPTPDANEISFRHVGTHLLLGGPGGEDVLECLRSGRCYVGFDWIADSSGFSFAWKTSRDSGLMGDVVSLRDKPVLVAHLPLPAEVLLVRDGSTVRRFNSANLEHHPEAPGLYRLEAYLNVAGEERPWILSNPIKVCR